MTWSNEEIEIINKNSHLLETDPGKFVGHLVESDSNFKSKIRIAFGVILITKSPIQLKKSMEDIEVWTKIGNHLPELLCYVEPNDPFEDNLEEQKKEFESELLTFYEIDQETVKDLVSLVVGKGLVV